MTIDINKSLYYSKNAKRNNCHINSIKLLYNNNIDKIIFGFMGNYKHNRLYFHSWNIYHNCLIDSTVPTYKEYHNDIWDNLIYFPGLELNGDKLKELNIECKKRKKPLTPSIFNSICDDILIIKERYGFYYL
jgi:hypothetical protein